MHNGASRALTATPELQIQFPSTSGKTIQKSTFQLLVKWQNRDKIWNLCIKTSLGVYLVRDSEPGPPSGSVSNYVPTVWVLS